MLDPKKVAAEHWEYIGDLLANHGIDEIQISEIGFHYQTAFVHGWKHGVEAIDSYKFNGMEFGKG